MDSDYKFIYKRHTLNCEPSWNVSLFGSRLGISDENGKKVRSRYFPPLGYFKNEAEAVEHAKRLKPLGPRFRGDAELS